jgi:hypothetical protein
VSPDLAGKMHFLPITDLFQKYPWAGHNQWSDKIQDPKIMWEINKILKEIVCDLKISKICSYKILNPDRNINFLVLFECLSHLWT